MIAMRVGLGPVGDGVNVVDQLEMRAQTKAFKNPLGIRRIAIGENDLASGQRIDMS